MPGEVRARATVEKAAMVAIHQGRSIGGERDGELGYGRAG